MERIYEVLIADFMKLPKRIRTHSWDASKDEIFYTKDGVEYKVGELKYDSSFDWLMDVVIKINTMEDFRYSTKILTMDVEIEDSHTLKIVAESSLDFNPDELLKSVYQCIVKFIKWYNQNN